MKRISIWTVALVLCLTTLIPANGVAQPIQNRLMRSQISLWPVKSEFAPGEQVEFVVRTTGGPLAVQSCSFVIERQGRMGQWTEFYRSGQSPLGQGFIGPGTERRFAWNPAMGMGKRMARPGSYRIVFYPYPNSPQLATIANFTVAGYRVTSNASLTLKLMRYNLTVGELVTFRLENVGTGPADLRDCSYVIERRQNDNWVEFLASETNPFSFNSMNPGDIQKWDWNQEGPNGHRAPRGEYRIVLYAPRVSNDALTSDNFIIR